MTEAREKMERHPIARLFPDPTPIELDNLCQGVIKSNGVRSKSPVITFEGKVIEKWHEYSICVDFNLPCSIKKYKGTTEDLISYLLKNSSTQLAQHNRALIAAHLKKSYRPNARKNQSIAGTGKQTPEVFHTRKAAAEFMKVSPRMVSNAESVIDSGNEEFLNLVSEGLLSVSRAADIARRKKQAEFVEAFWGGIQSVLLEKSETLTSKEEKAREKYEKEVRGIKDNYKKKREALSRNMSRDISLADTPEKEKELKQERLKSRRDLKKYENINLEKAKLDYEKQRMKFHKSCNDELNKEKKTFLADLVPEFLEEEEREYLVYMRWDYELGKIELRVAYDKMKFHDEAKGIITLNSGRKVLVETEAIIFTHTADMAREICDKINKQEFCRGKEIFGENSWQQKIYNRIGEEFMEKARRIM